MSDYTYNTYTGRLINPLTMGLTDVCIEDIAHALAMRPHFGGHAQEFFSIAQHCCLVAKHRHPPLLPAVALLHDASEAYLWDIVRPLKTMPEFQTIVEIERRIQDMIFCKYIKNWTLIRNQPEGNYHEADNRVLTAECRALLSNWEKTWIGNQPLDCSILIRPWSWQESEQTFLTLAYAFGIRD